jgi:tripartite-type tricarboxylate transporter receptor subunit TctC
MELRVISATPSTREGGDRRARVRNFIHNIAAATIAFGLIVTASVARADYPARSITLIVPFAAGGPTDVVARILATHMASTLGQQIIIENIIGSGGTTAAIRAMRAPSDGYTLMMGHMGTHGAAVALYPNLAYSPASDFEPIGMAVGMPVLILGRKGLPARSLAEFVADARSNPSPMHMAHAGLGSVSYASCLMLNAIIGIHPTMTPFQGTGPAMNALAAGRVDYMCDQIVSALPKIQADLVTAYATGSARRNPALPDLPTATEAGLPGFKVSAWNALFAPKGTPPNVVATLNRALSQALDNPAIGRQLRDLGGEIATVEERTPQALSALVSSEVDRWMQVNATMAVPSR